MLHYDVAVIGGGPSGMAAALAASKEGASVLLLETEPRLGGILNQCIHNGFGLHIFKEELTGPEYAHRFIRQIQDSPVEVLLNTLVLDVSPGRQVLAVSKERGLLEIQAGAVVFSTGCRERPRGAIGIPGTRPAGVITAGAAQKYVNIDGYLPGRECVILGSGDIGLIMARRMTLEGAKVKAVVELMPYSSGLARNIKQCLDDFGIPLLLSHTVVEIHGKNRVDAVTIAKVDDNLSPIPGTEEIIPCDTLLLSVGLIPTVELATKAGAELAGSQVRVDQHFSTSHPGLFICGNTLHVHDLVDYVTEESTVAGQFAAAYAKGARPADGREIPIQPGEGITYTVPQRFTGESFRENITLRFRTRRVYKQARLVLSSGGKTIASFKRPVMAPGEMQTLVLKPELLNSLGESLSLHVEE